MHLHNVSLLYDPTDVSSHETARQAATCLRGQTRFVLLPADRHLPGRMEDLDVGAAINFIPDPQKALQAESLCELLEIPVAGDPARIRQSFSDQVLLRDFLTFHNLPVPAYYVPRENLDHLAFEHRNFGYPVQVRRRIGNHPVVTATCFEDLLARVLCFRGMPGGVVIERVVPGHRIRTAVWRKKVLGSAQTRLFTDEKSLTSEGMLIPPDMPPSRLRNLERLAERLAWLLHVDNPLLVTLAHDAISGDQLVDIQLCPMLTRDAPFTRIASAFGVSQKDLFAWMLGQITVNRFSQTIAKSSWTCG